MKKHLTKRIVESLPVPETGGRLVVFDDKLVGFGVAVHPTGRRTFFVQYGPRDRRNRVTLGTFPGLTVDLARSQAMEELEKINKGLDPQEMKKAEDAMPTFAEWVARHLATLTDRKRSWKKDALYLGHAVERWGNRRLDSVSAEDVRRLFETVRERGVFTLKSALKGERGRRIQEKAKARWKGTGPKNTTANRWLASLRACFSAAWRLDLIPDNPARKVKPLPENLPRQRVLTDEEMGRVLEAIATLTDPYARAALTLLVETGARGSEVLAARWQDMDLDGKLWRLPRPKSGKPQVIPLADSTVAMLRNLKRAGEWVITGLDPLKPRACLKGPWEAVQEKAGVQDVHLHDLRRTFGLHAARRYGLHVAQKLLRHSTVTVTERVYAPLGIEELRAATNGMSKERGKVIPMRPRRA